MRALLLGGRSPTCSAERDLWVFEPSLVVRPQVDPDPFETNATVGLFSNTSGGTLPGVSWATGDGGTVTGATARIRIEPRGVHRARDRDGFLRSAERLLGPGYGPSVQPRTRRTYRSR